MPAPRFETDLPLLLAGGFRLVLDRMHAQLDAEGFDDVRPLYGFALQAIGREGVTTSELGRRLGITKQAAAKTVARLEDARLITRSADQDRRAQRLNVSERGRQLLAVSARAIVAERRRWIDQLGEDRLTALEDGLRILLTEAGDVDLHGLPGLLR